MIISLDIPLTTTAGVLRQHTGQGQRPQPGLDRQQQQEDRTENAGMSKEEALAAALAKATEEPVVSTPAVRASWAITDFLMD